MNKIITRIAQDESLSIENIIEKNINKLLPKFINKVQTKILTIKNIKSVNAKNSDDLFDIIENQIKDLIYNYLLNNPIKLTKKEMNVINQRDLINEIYNATTYQICDDYAYPFIRLYLNTITTANKLFSVLTEANILDKFIISLITDCSFITANLKKLLMNKKPIKSTLLFIINSKILEANEENCQLINSGLVKTYQQELKDVLSGGWNAAYINISISELKKFLQLIKNENINIKNIINEKIGEAQDSIDNNTINSPEELMSISIKVGQTVKISNAFHNNTHSLSAQPVLYFNGNLINNNIKTSIKLNTDTERLYHKTLLDKYLGDESLHKNDIIKKPIEEWRRMRDSVENTLVYIFSGEFKAASIIIYKYGIIFYALPQFIEDVTNMLQVYNKPIFYMNNSATELTKIASRLHKQLYLTRIF